MRERLIAALNHRVKVFAETDDPALVLEQAALEEAAELRRLSTQRVSGQEALPLEEAYVLAYLHWCRYVALPAGQDREDYEASRVLFAALAKVRPALVPEQMRRDLAAEERRAKRIEAYCDRQVEAKSLHDRARAARDPAALDAAIEAQRDAVALIATVDRKGHALALTSLSELLRERLQWREDGWTPELAADLDEAIALRRAALAITDPDAPDYGEHLDALADLTWWRYRRSGELRHLDELIEARRSRVAGVEGGDALVSALLDLVKAVDLRIQSSTDRFTDLDEAVEALRTGLEALPEDHPERVTLQANLASARLLRFEITGNLADLVDANQLARDARAAVSGDDDRRLPILQVLGRVLRAWFDRRPRPEYLQEAVAVMRDALALTPAGHPKRAEVLIGLALSYGDLYDHGNDPKVLDAEIDTYREVIDATATDDPMRANRLGSLGMALRQRFERTRSGADLEEAVAVARAAVADAPAKWRPRNLVVLGDVLVKRYEVGRNRADAAQAIAAWREAAESPSLDVPIRMRGARQFGALAHATGDPNSGLTGYALALDLLQRHAWWGLNRAERERRLQGWTVLAADAAACAISADQPERAIELLEQGRSVLWGQRDALRADLASLALAHPSLARRLEDLRKELEAGGDRTTDLFVEPFLEPEIVLQVGDVEGRNRLAREWDTTVAEIRALPGFADFLRPPRFADLHAAAAAGPVLVVNASTLRCDVLAVTGAGITVLPLPSMTVRTAIDRTSQYLTALQDFDRGPRGPIQRVTLETAIAEVLAWLWDEIAGPTLDALGYRSPPRDGEPWPRVWWCPTGPFTLLPLHAAGRHDPAGGGGTVCDRVVSSYTPTLRALVQARAAAPVGTAQRLLVVSLPETADLRPLPGAAREATALPAMFPGDHTVLEGPQATWERVLDELGRHEWMHFACHSVQPIHNPTSPALQLHDRALQVLDLGWARLTSAEFAFLSACETAVGGGRLWDEALHPAAALQLAGCRHVIGTLWNIGDDLVDIVTDVYRQLVADGQPDPAEAAVAVHRALRRARASDPWLATRWAPLVHLGP
jgi:tetratricopeptide (TPR) repeat protein